MSETKGTSHTNEWAFINTIPQFDHLPEAVVNLNVMGRSPTSPMEGFGALRLRTYRAKLPGIKMTPSQVIQVWKNGFSGFWPAGNTFIPLGDSIKPGVTGLINLSLPGGLKLFTGAMVMHAGAESFSLMTLQGHMFSGWITFSSFTEDGCVCIQTQALLRPNDPLYELSFLVGFGSSSEDRFWHSTLQNLARYFDVCTDIEQEDRMVDHHVQWKYFGNLWYNAAIRSVLFQMITSFRKVFNQSSTERVH